MEFASMGLPGPDELARTKRVRARRTRPILLTVLASFALPSTAFAINGIPDRQAGIRNLRQSLNKLWATRVTFQANGRPFVGFASHASVDDGTPIWGDEAGSSTDSPIWDFQGGQGTVGPLIAFLRAYQLTGDVAQLRRAEQLGETLLYVQDQLGGGWFYDGAIIDGQYRNVGIWGSWGSRRHPEADLQGWFTLDDGVSQSAALALLRLYQATGDARWLAGAERFAAKLHALQDINVGGQYPYRTGGLPQALPFEKALVTGYQQNNDARNPDRPYQIHKTLNDNTLTDAMIVLMELARETGKLEYFQDVRLHVDFLLNRYDETGRRGWAQQYHYLTNQPCWGRHMEPPSFVTCENRVVDALLQWRAREGDVARRARIESAIVSYLSWLNFDVPKPPDQPNVHWRYYSHEPGPSVPVFAANYNRMVGAEYESAAAGGQPYRARWDLTWYDRLTSMGAHGIDFNRAANYLRSTHDAPLGINTAVWSPTAQLPDAAYYVDINVNGRSRRCLMTWGTVNRTDYLINQIETMGGAVVDSDGDGFSDEQEAVHGTDPLDSDSFPLTKGDVNCDGVVSLGDISPFVLILQSPEEFESSYSDCDWHNADIDGNGVVNVGDIGPFIGVLISD
jgi:hypothetical protein